MSGPVELVWVGDDAASYDHGPQHPLRPQRFALTRSLIHDYGLVGGSTAVETAGRDATDAELGLVHTDGYVDAVKRAGRGESGSWWQYGFGPGDNPVFPNMHEAATRVTGTTLAAAEAVLSGRALHAFNPAGGLHHAMAGQASGFCVYDDPAVAIALMLAQGVQRIAYVDLDVHHGDGPQSIFWDEPRVLTVSVHQDGRTLFPGTGGADEIGGEDARGTKVNVPLPPGTGDELWLRALHEVVVPVVVAFAPEVLVTQLGCDTHHLDPLAGLMLTTGAYERAAALLHDLAHEAAQGRWVATGGGGYQWARVVPRAWTIYFAAMVGVELDDELPEQWLARLESISHFTGDGTYPRLLRDAPLTGLGGDSAQVTAVLGEVRQRVFGYYGRSR